MQFLLYVNDNGKFVFQDVEVNPDGTYTFQEIPERHIIAAFYDSGVKKGLSNSAITPIETYAMNDDLDMSLLQDHHFQEAGRTFVFTPEEVVNNIAGASSASPNADNPNAGGETKSKMLLDAEQAAKSLLSFYTHRTGFTIEPFTSFDMRNMATSEPVFINDNLDTDVLYFGNWNRSNRTIDEVDIKHNGVVIGLFAEIDNGNVFLDDISVKDLAYNETYYGIGYGIQIDKLITNVGGGQTIEFQEDAHELFGSFIGLKITLIP